MYGATDSRNIRFCHFVVKRQAQQPFAERVSVLHGTADATEFFARRGRMQRHVMEYRKDAPRLEMRDELAARR